VCRPLEPVSEEEGLKIKSSFEEIAAAVAEE